MKNKTLESKMKKAAKILSALAMAALLASGARAEERFVPKEPVMPLSQIRPGMLGYAKTVLQGTKITPFKVKIVGVVPSKSKPRNLIMIEVLDKYIRENGGIAAGMSGSPVYVDGRLIGAIGYSWSFADGSMGLVTPVEEMLKAMEWRQKLPRFDVPPLPPDEAGKKDAENAAASGDKAPGREAASADKIISADKAASGDKAAPGGETASGDAALSGDKTISEGATSEDKEILSGDVKIDFDEEASGSGAPREKMTLASDGVSARYAARLGKKLGVSIIPLGSEPVGSSPVDLRWRPEPGAAVGAAIAWGDVVVGGVGTLTAVSKDGRFIAFAHPMFNRGGVSYALTQASILRTVPSIESSFKLGYLGKIAGVVTQDRPEAIGGRLGQLAAASSYTVNFHDVDERKKETKRFQTVADPFIGPEIGSAGILGLVDDLWARKGAGTALVAYTVSGGNMKPSWTRRNIFYSPKDAVKAMQKEIESLGKVISRNPFREINPYGVTVDVEMTKTPRVVYIDKIEIEDEKEEYSPGDKVKAVVTFRPWRKAPVKKTFELRVPENAVSFCEVTARGGGIEEPEEEPLITGIRAITTFKEFVTELSAKETNNQIIVEIGGPEKDSLEKKKPHKSTDKDKEKLSESSAVKEEDSENKKPEAGRDKKENKKKGKDSFTPADMMEERFVSEINAERIKNREMVVADTNYYVEGVLRTFIKVKGGSASDMLQSKLAQLMGGGEDEEEEYAPPEDEEDEGGEDDGDDDEGDGEGESLSFSGFGRGAKRK